MLKLAPWVSAGVIVALTALTSTAQAVGSPPTFSKRFVPEAIGPGSSSRLIFTIAGDGAPASDLSFSDTLPTGVLIATPANVYSDCRDGVLSAPDGGSTISLAGARIAGQAQCTIAVDVISSSVATHSNVSGALSSSEGSSGTASDDLTVSLDRPGISQSFVPDTVSFGGRSRLTLTIDNTANGGNELLGDFRENLPAGIVIADPPDIFTDCRSSSISALPGDHFFDRTFDFVGTCSGSPSTCDVLAGGSCLISLDVIGQATGVNTNSSTALIIDPGFGGSAAPAGFANAALTVLNAANTVVLDKDFVSDTVRTGDTVALRFTIFNLDRTAVATALSFTDDLNNMGLAGIAAQGLPKSDVCGAGSVLSGSDSNRILTLAGGTLASEASCTFEVDVLVPAGTASGRYGNTSGAVSADFNGAPVVGNTASDDLFVAPLPVFTMEFTDDPVPAGGSVTLEYNIENTAPVAASDINFSDELTTILPFPLSLAALPSNPCGAGSTLDLVSFGTERSGLQLFSGNLAAAGSPGDSCTFSISINIPAAMPSGRLTNTTEFLAATLGADKLIHPGISDDLVVVGAPQLIKEFPAGPALPGGTASLVFTIRHDASAPGDATGITFTDDLASVLGGLTAQGLPLNDICGTGSTLSASAGDTLLTFADGQLAPGDTCSFSVLLNIPAAAQARTYTNTSSALSAVVEGQTAVGNVAEDELIVAGLSLTKEFLDDPVIAGGTVAMEFTISNVSATESASSIVFEDNLRHVMQGLTATGLPLADPCGVGSSFVGSSGDTELRLSGGSLAAGETCTFSVNLQVPALAVTDFYSSSTDVFFANWAGTLVVFPNAVDTLQVSSDLLLLTKSFTDDPVAPGGTVTLQFQVSNLDPVNAASDITFSDDLDAVIPGLVASTLPADGFCNGSGSIVGSSTLTASSLTLAAGGSCSFSVSLSVPSPVAIGTQAENTTSTITGTVGGLAVSGDPAHDTLNVAALDFSKAFAAGGVGAGTQVQLNFSLSNPSAVESASELSFQDDLAAFVAGAVAVGLPLNDVCGAGSTVSGTSLVQLRGGSLAPGASCDFAITVQLPGTVVAGVYSNTSSNLTQLGSLAALPATADLTVEPAPLFSKDFAAAQISQGGRTRLTFTIDNSAAATAAVNLQFSDPLPAGLRVDSAPATSTTCGGTVSASANATTISFAGGSVTAGASCIIGVNVFAASSGNKTNVTQALTSSLGDSGTATAILGVNPPPNPPVNRAPVAQADVYEVDEDGATTTLRVLSNDSDPDGDSLSTVLLAGLTPADAGNLQNLGSTFEFTPAIDYCGAASFSYQADDGALASESVAVDLNIRCINDPPSGSPADFVVQPNTVLIVDAPGVLMNATDADADSLSAFLISAPSVGELSLQPDGSFQYTPASGAATTASFTFAVLDGKGGESEPITVTLIVSAQNQAPSAANQRFSTDEDTVLRVPKPGVLAAASDADGDALTAIVVTPPANGVLVLQADGRFKFTPAENFNGVVTFSYQVQDARGARSQAASVALTVNAVNDAPQANNIPNQVLAQDQVISFDLKPFFSDVDGDALLFAANLPAGFALNDGLLSGQWPLATLAGTVATVEASATDQGQLAAETSFLLTLQSSNQDIAVTASLLPDFAAAVVGDQFSLNAVLNNQLPELATGVALAGQITGPVSIDLPSACSGDASSFRCVPVGGSLPASASETFELALETTGAGDVYAVLFAEPLAGDQQPADNRVVVHLLVTQEQGTVPDLSLNGGGAQGVAGDIDGDQDADLIFAGPNGLVVLQNVGEGGYVPVVLSEASVRAARLGDMNGDGIIDLVTLELGGDDIARYAIRLNDGAGNFADPDFRPAGNAVDFELADFNGDGSLDIVGANQSPNRVLINDGTAQLQLLLGLGDEKSYALATGDIDDDGDIDVVFANEDAAGLWLNQGDASFSDVQRLAQGRLLSAVMADFNGDGLLDLAFGRSSAPGDEEPPANPVLFNDGQQGFEEQSSLGAADTLDLLALDIDQDGDQDLLSLDVPGILRYYLNDGAGTFAAAAAPLLSESAVSVSAVDTDGDGEVDLLVNTGEEDSVVFLSGGAPTVESKPSPGGSRSRGIFGIGQLSWALIFIFGLLSLRRRLFAAHELAG